MWTTCALLAAFLLSLNLIGEAPAAGTDGSISISKLHFFMHDMVDLQNPANATTALVASPNNNLTAMATLGSVMVIDDKLTSGPSPDSAMVGRARGFYMSDSASKSMASLGIFLTFTAELENGTISMQGQDNILQQEREISVIGGTGMFRSATGYALITTNKMIPPLSVVLDVQVFFRTRNS